MSDFERNVRDGKNLHKLPFGYLELVHGAKLCAQGGISKIKKTILFDPP